VKFDDIAGQKEIISSISSQLAGGEVGHAYVFTGPEGIGKRTMARIFSSSLLCSERNGSDACGRCKSCRLFDSGSNPDYKVIEPEGNSISIDEIREMQGDIIIRPLYSDKKVYVIIDADKMTVQAQNCLLKTLEEPPEYAVIIMTTANYHALLETIRSRAQRYSFKKNTPDEIRSVLTARFGPDIPDMDFYVSYCDGIIGTAVKLAESGEFKRLRDETISLAIKLSRSQLSDALDAYGFFESNKDSISHILDILLLIYRDLMIAVQTGNQKLLINSDKKDIIFNNIHNFTTHKLAENIEAVETARSQLKYNANFQLAMEVMLMKLQGK